MIDGSAHMMNLILSLKAAGGVVDKRGQSVLDGPHWFDTYECKDGNFISLGSLEPQFYALLLATLGITDYPTFKSQLDPKQWPAQKTRLAEIIKSKTRDKWTAIMEGTDICFAPVLNPSEAADHAHLKSRKIYQKHRGNLETAAAPRFKSRSQQTLQISATKLTIQQILDSWAKNRK